MIELVGKLPPSKQLQWAEHSMTLNNRATAVEFSAWLKIIARCVTMLTSTSSLASQNQTITHHHNNQSQNQQRNRNLDRHILNVNRVQVPTCGVCKGPHRVIDCDKFLNFSVSTRWEEARRLGLCFGCLRSGHLYEECRSKKRCSVDGCPSSH